MFWTKAIYCFWVVCLPVLVNAISQEHLEGVCTNLAKTPLELKNEQIWFWCSKVTVTLQITFKIKWCSDSSDPKGQRSTSPLHHNVLHSACSLAIVQSHNSGAEGETGTIFHIWLDTKLVALILDARFRDLLCCWVEHVGEAHSRFRIHSFLVFHQNQLYWPNVWTHTKNVTVFLFLSMNLHTNRYTAVFHHKLCCKWSFLSVVCRNRLKVKTACFSLDDNILMTSNLPENTLNTLLFFSLYHIHSI